MKINDVMFNCDLNDVLTKLRSQVDYFEKIKPSGNDIMVQCPYHSNGKERKPSAGIRKEDGQFHCFACGEVHTLPEVISYCFGKDDGGIYGWGWLIKNYVLIETEERNDINLDMGRNKDSRFVNSSGVINSNSCNTDSKYISQEELDRYRYIHPYMYERKLTDEIIELFDIGYDDETETITFPVRDMTGNTLFVARRKIKYKSFFYPAGVEKPLYGLYELYKNPLYMPSEVIVCESMFDALTCWVYGKKAVAFNGLGSELQFKQLREMPCRKLILATDNDEAGMRARQRIRKEVKNKIITEYILPDNRKDINELTKDEFDNLKEVF